MRTHLLANTPALSGCQVHTEQEPDCEHLLEQLCQVGSRPIMVAPSLPWVLIPAMGQVQSDDPDTVFESSAAVVKSDMRTHRNSKPNAFSWCQVQCLQLLFWEHFRAQADQLFIPSSRPTTDLPCVFVFISGQPSRLDGRDVVVVFLVVCLVVGNTIGGDVVTGGFPYKD